MRGLGDDSVARYDDSDSCARPRLTAAALASAAPAAAADANEPFMKPTPG